MNDKAIIKGVYADYRRVKGRKVLQVIVEVPLEQAPLVHEAFGEPDPAGDTWVAVALLQPETARVAEQKDKHRLSRQAAMCCQEQAFWTFLSEYGNGPISIVRSAPEAAATVRYVCGVDSRAEFDSDLEAAARWRNLHASYQAWLNV